VYKCTPSHLDDHRDCFTLDVRVLASLLSPISVVIFCA